MFKENEEIWILLNHRIIAAEMIRLDDPDDPDNPTGVIWFRELYDHRRKLLSARNILGCMR